MIKKMLVVLPAVIITIVVGVVVFYKYSISPVSDDSTLKEVVIEPGSIESIGYTLKENNLIRDPKMFKIYVKISGQTNLQASTYMLSEDMGVEKIVDILESGKSYNPNEVTLTFKEGINMRDIVTLICDNTNNNEEDVFKLLDSKDYLNSLKKDYWFLTDDINDPKIYYSLEGYLFPATYTYMNKDIDAKDIFSDMLDKTKEKLEPYKDKINASKYSVHELLTIASIVESEGANVEDRKNIAGVFYNRLDSNITLGSDVTTYYGLKINMGDRELTTKELLECNDYNTRCLTFFGLPVSPISIPSIESIEAAIEPNNHDYVYFVADKNKKTYFTKTINEHEKLVTKLKNEGMFYEHDE